MTPNDEQYMKRAIERAKYALTRGYRPFGNVIMDAEGYYRGGGWGSETPADPTRHSELAAIQEACKLTGGLLHGCTLYSTHEPCMMCTGAILHSKLSRVVWGSFRSDLPELFRPLSMGLARFGDTSHPPEVKGGVLRRECIALFAGELETARASIEFPDTEFRYDPSTDECPECEAKPGEPCIAMRAIATGFPDGIPDCPRKEPPT